MLFLLGDCLEKMAGLPAKSVDLFLCDLPYGCLTGGNTNKSLMRIENGIATGKRAETPTGVLSGCTWDIKIDLAAFWEQVKRLARDDHTPVIMFCSTKFGSELINSNPSWFRYDLVWSKTNGVGFLSANKQPLRSHEMMYVFAKKGAYYKRVDIEGDFKRGTGGRTKSNVYATTVPNITIDNTGKRCVKSVVDVANRKGRGNHPTQKPDELYKWLIDRYCKDDGTVLDPTAGSFSSCFVAAANGKRAIGIEKDRGFFWKAVGRAARPEIKIDTAAPSVEVDNEEDD